MNLSARSDNMRDRPIEEFTDALPRHLLPDALPPSDATELVAMRERIMERAGGDLELLRIAGAQQNDWAGVFAAWLRPAAGLACAAGVLLFVMIQSAPAPPRSPGAVALGVLATGGEPVALWNALGVEADPVLALFAYEEAIQ
jgi:hypothetical protein